jgi:hypothetical protein
MDVLSIRVVRMDGGYLKAILPGQQETVFGRDNRELDGKLKRLGMREKLKLEERKSPR